MIIQTAKEKKKRSIEAIDVERYERYNVAAITTKSKKKKGNGVTKKQQTIMFPSFQLRDETILKEKQVIEIREKIR